MRWHEHIVNALVSVAGNNVRHGGTIKSNRYVTWMEDGGSSITSDNIHNDKVITGTADLYSKTEFDTWIDRIEAAFDASPYIFWTLNSVQKEEETGFWHYEWRWEVLDGQDDI